MLITSDAGTHGSGVGRVSLELLENRLAGAGSGQNQFRHPGANGVVLDKLVA